MKHILCITVLRAPHDIVVCAPERARTCTGRTHTFRNGRTEPIASAEFPGVTSSVAFGYYNNFATDVAVNEGCAPASVVMDRAAPNASSAMADVRSPGSMQCVHAAARTHTRLKGAQAVY
jgi:hypothetical protein